MSFVVQRVSGSSMAMHQIDGDILRIGRGTNCELRSDNPTVALLHAEIRAGLRAYTIVDKGSVTGTYVNRKPVEWKTLAENDEIEIGDLRIVVQVADATKPLFLRVSPLAAPEVKPQASARRITEKKQFPAGEALHADKTDYAVAYRLRRPYLTKVAPVSVLLIALLLAINELLQPGRQSLMMPGPLSSGHSLARDKNGQSIATNCNACHEPWRSVSNVKCTACHGRAPHAERQVETPACTFCHTEHRGQPRLAMIADTRCLTCHAELARHVKGPAPPAATHVRGFGIEHPEFQPVADPALMPFSHKKHLNVRGVATNGGKKEVLRCESCHRFVPRRGTVDPAPLDFYRDCHRCHQLTFDENLPTVEVPHGGDPNVVYGFVVMTYLNSGSQDATTRAMKSADDLLNTTCRECHKIEKRGERLAAVPPILPALWLPHAQFTHTSHRNIDCESCHEHARTSTKSADVLMPTQRSCVQCHGPQRVKVTTTCATCHVYHERSRLLLANAAAGTVRRDPPAPAPATKTMQMLQTVLLYAVVILLLVILIPVGFAFYAYLRARFVRPVSAKKPEAAPPPPAPQPLAVTTAPSDATRTGPPDAEPAPAATELLRWYGMLRCTGGPLAGQRFIIPEEGLWIGRDASLSQVVVDDARISKRHVRIMPRSGHIHAIDVESRNGTYIDRLGERITDVEIKRGATVILADNVAAFVFEG